MRSTQILLLSTCAALTLTSCVGEDPTSRAFALKYCGGIPTQGCCNLGTLLYCNASGYPMADPCIGTPKCGWNAGQQRYTCNTSGGADPAGKYPISCLVYSQDMKVPDTGWYDTLPRDGFKVDKLQPDQSKADATPKDAAKADAAKADAAKPDAAKPDAATPDAAKPDLPAPDYGAAKCGDGKCHKLAEDCQTCPADCGYCTGCEVRTTPKCSTCACEACVCAQDPWCCSKLWDAVCVAKCKGPCNGCKQIQLPEAGVPDGPTCGDGLCTPPAEDCQSCPSDCGNCTGCQIRSSPKCSTCACEACVCAQDPDCCKYGWDQLCVERCKKKCGGCKLKPVDAGPTPDKAKPADLPQTTDKAKPADLPQTTDKGKPVDLPKVSDKAKPADLPQPTDKGKPSVVPKAEHRSS